MPRLQIELTSARPDGTWTWRVAGARQPKGVVAGALLPTEAKVGDVYRVEADVELEGTTVRAVVAEPPKRQEPERLELLGTPKPFEAVTTSLLPKGSRPRRSGWDGGLSDRGNRPGDRAGGGRFAGPGVGRSGPPSRSGRDAAGPGSASETSGEGAGAGAAADDRPRSSERRPGGGGPERGTERHGDRPGRPAGPGGRRSSGDPRRPGEAGGPGDRGRAGGGGAPGRPGRPARAEGRETGLRSVGPRPPAESAPKAKRLSPANTHRSAVLETLPPEQRAVADQILHGGIPAVRRALQEQNTKAKAEGQPEITAEAIVALAEELLPRLKSAEWRDRAEAAAADLENISLRDLRSVVAGADAARDDESRLLAKSLREGLQGREEAQRQAWITDVGASLDEGRLVRALRLAGRPPDPWTRCPAELATRLSEAAGAAMSADAVPERWLTVLEAVLDSPVRRSVKPAGLPAGAPPAVLNAARQASGRVPALASMLGIDIPPPPRPARGATRPLRPPPRPPRPHAPPPPPLDPAPEGRTPESLPAEAQSPEG